MHMMDWNQYYQQVVAGVSNLAKLTPETVRGYGAMGTAGAKTGHFDAKTRELIAVAVSITLRCDGKRIEFYRLASLPLGLIEPPQIKDRSR